VAEIKDNIEFLEWITKSDSKFERKRFDKRYCRPLENTLYLNELKLKDIDIDDRHFECIEFKNCSFENCDFTSSFITHSRLENCSFKKCRFTWSKFLEVDLFYCKFEECIITGLELGDVEFKETLFIDCSEILDLLLRGQSNRSLSFKNCYLHFFDIEPIDAQSVEKFEFIDCIIKESSFDRIDFSKSQFKDCDLSLIQFSSCTLNESTFSGFNQCPGNEFNLIDIRTILNSDHLSSNLLEKLFGIHNSEIKEYLLGLTSKIEFQSVFISYSFCDKAFAKRINDELKRKGIFTFLWEKDSPGGQPLKKIMSSEVKARDRILFIASSNSLKSEACQFELTEGIKKQNQTWNEVLFPIHIDNFLFEVEKDQIRPIEKQDEYWKNIEELRRMNSLSFIQFLDSDIDNFEFDRQIFRLIKGLRKK
jgi:uncharacterized protein YjbI with pentapeptide repeats